MTTLNPAISVFHIDADAENDKKKLTVDEFFAYLEANPNARAELIDGVPLAMSGGTLNHSIIADNCLDVKSFLMGKEPTCYACNSDFGIQTKENQIRYPDFSIVCNVKGTAKFSDKPLVVGEVLSEKSTALFDKTEELEEYKGVTSMQEIFLISQVKKEVLAYRRSIFGWNLQICTSGLVEFRSIGYTVDIDKLYTNVDFGNN